MVRLFSALASVVASDAVPSERQGQGRAAGQAGGDGDRGEDPAAAGCVGCKDQAAEGGEDGGEHDRVGEGDMERAARRHAVHDIDLCSRYTVSIHRPSSLTDRFRS